MGIGDMHIIKALLVSRIELHIKVQGLMLFETAWIGPS